MCIDRHGHVEGAVTDLLASWVNGVGKRPGLVVDDHAPQSSAARSRRCDGIPYSCHCNASHCQFGQLTSQQSNTDQQISFRSR
jgi:hypothetical protein